jgi:hypothetical protein
MNSNCSTESVNMPGKFLSLEEGSQSHILLSSKMQLWKSQNLLLVNSSSYAATSAVIQDWSVIFQEPGFNITNIQQFAKSAGAGQTKCYPQNPGFNQAFEAFAIDFVILDATMEQDCINARERMGFDGDHMFDTDVCDSFNKHMCDPFFLA